MNTKIIAALLVCIATIVLIATGFRNHSVTSGSDVGSIPMCAPGSLTVPGVGKDGKFIAAMPGWGTYHVPISTTSDSAQFYFDQGFTFYYSYHMKESLASFKEAARHDPQCAMAHWGQALAMGPYYNSAHSYKVPDGIGDVIRSMNGANGNRTARESRLVECMNRRYPNGTSGQEPAELNRQYAQSMKELVNDYPEDADIATLYVDAVMLMHAWDFWNADGSAKPWTEELVAIVERVLRNNPDHPGALHYHIHLTEASHQPQVALPNADKLRDLLPGVAHMVHMASHEYQRNGLYDKGVMVNDLADANLVAYQSAAPHLGLNTYSPHYFGVQTYCALTGGMYETAMKSALRCRKSVTPKHENTYDQYLFMLPILTQVRMGKWAEILADTTQLDQSWTYARLLRHFAQGMAASSLGQNGKAQTHLNELKALVNDPILRKRRIPFNDMYQTAQVAQGILAATIAFRSGEHEMALAELSKAIVIEDQLIYTEPADWPLPARQYLGSFFLQLKRPKDAAEVFRADLVHNPGNGWSLTGLKQSWLAQGISHGVDSLTTIQNRAFIKADKRPTGAVYW